MRALRLSAVVVLPCWPTLSSRSAELAPVSLSLNSSAIYLGSATGATVGALVIAHAAVGRLDWMAAGISLAALLTVLHWPRRQTTDSSTSSVEVAISVDGDAIFIANTLLETGPISRGTSGSSSMTRNRFPATIGDTTPATS